MGEGEVKWAVGVPALSDEIMGLRNFSLKPKKRTLDLGTRGKRWGKGTECSFVTSVLGNRMKAAPSLVIWFFLLPFPVSSAKLHDRLRLVLALPEGIEGRLRSEQAGAAHGTGVRIECWI